MTEHLLQPALTVSMKLWEKVLRTGKSFTLSRTALPLAPESAMNHSPIMAPYAETSASPPTSPITGGLTLLPPPV